MIKTKDSRNKVLRQNNLRLAVKFGNTVEYPISHRILCHEFTRLSLLNDSMDLGILGLMRF